MITCAYCDRLYSEYSILIHRKKCKDNPNVIFDTSIFVTKNLGPFGVNKKRRKEERPRTRSLCRHKEVPHRICFICGAQFGSEYFVEHEQMCLEEWRALAEKVPSKFQLFDPVPLSIPSLDGSLDIQRLNEHAAAQSKKAQNPRCKRCGKNVPILVCSQHTCLKREPSIEYCF